MMVAGIGTNRGGKYPTSAKGRVLPLYDCWRGMLRRCYEMKRLEQRPTYKDVTVDAGFIDYQDFAEWSSTQIGAGVRGYQIDKDILVTGSRVYAPETCVFVPQALNAFLVDSRAIRGACPQGVCWHKRDQKFRVQMKQNSKVRCFGYYDRVEDAAAAYAIAKTNEAKRWASRLQAGEFVIDQRVIEFLLNYQFKEKL